MLQKRRPALATPLTDPEMPESEHGAFMGCQQFRVRFEICEREAPVWERVRRQPGADSRSGERSNGLSRSTAIAASVMSRRGAEIPADQRIESKLAVLVGAQVQG
jgi:hypothetical protein